MTMDELVAELRAARERAEAGGGTERIARHHAQGKLTARERIAELTDRGSFEELGLFARHRAEHFGMPGKEAPADGVVTGAARVDGRLVHLASQDFTVMGGAAGEVHSRKIAEVMDRALATGSPFVFVHDSGGARIQEGVDALSGYGQVFRANVALSGVVPQISVICGPCAGGAAYSPALGDFVIQTRQARMFLAGPAVVAQATGEVIDAEALGGPEAHMARSGVVHFVAEDDRDALALCRRLLSFLPSSCRENPPRAGDEGRLDPDPELGRLVPILGREGYDVRAVLGRVVDGGDLLEVQAGHARNVVAAFARLGGRPVGVIANQPSVLSGQLDIDACDKAARFIRFCDAFNLPVVTFVDVPGFRPGVAQEHGGLLRHGAKLVFAYAAATVPKLQVILRRSHGGAHVAMGSKDLGADRVLAWPTAEIAVMSAEGAAEIVFHRELDEASDRAAARAELVERYRSTFSSPFVAAGRRLVDDVIDPADTRRRLVHALSHLPARRAPRPEGRGLIPL